MQSPLLHITDTVCCYAKRTITAHRVSHYIAELMGTLFRNMARRSRLLGRGATSIEH